MVRALTPAKKSEVPQNTLEARASKANIAEPYLGVPRVLRGTGRHTLAGWTVVASPARTRPNSRRHFGTCAQLGYVLRFASPRCPPPAELPPMPWLCLRRLSPPTASARVTSSPLAVSCFYTNPPRPR